MSSTSSSNTHRRLRPCSRRPPDDMDAKIAQIKKLGELKDQGLLTDAEFAEQKNRILGL